MTKVASSSRRWLGPLAGGCLLLLLLGLGSQGAAPDPAAEYATQVRPFLTQHCLSCHSTKKKKGDLDLERFTSLDSLRKDLRAWQGVAEMLQNGEMPPKTSPQPRPEDRQRLVRWVRATLDAEARARAGDPGRVVMRRLSNAEYDNTIRDLTGVDLQPTRDFPVDGAAGEGFTNAGDALVISPTLLNKYLNAAKETAGHVVLLPDGFRFAPATTRRDWTDEILAELRAFYRQHTPDGRLVLQPFVSAVVRHRDDLIAGKATLEAVAAREKLNLKYLRFLWETLADGKPSFPLDRVRARWRTAKPGDTAAVLAEIAAWQGPLWRFVKIGSYRDRNTIRQLPNDPALAASQTLRLPLKPEPGQSEAALYLAARELSAGKEGSLVVWHRPRFEGKGLPPLLLRDYSRFGEQFEVDYRVLFADTARYLAAAVESVNDRKQTVTDLAGKHKLDSTLLKHWLEVLDIEPLVKVPAKPTPAVTLEPLDRKVPGEMGRPAIKGWRHPTADLPVFLSNNSDRAEAIPGRALPHKVVVHPTPTQFVAAAWSSPVAGVVRVTGKVIHAHPACGNGIAWFVEHRKDSKAVVLGEGITDFGQESTLPVREVQVARGDLIVLAIDARDGNHSCDLTEITFTITEAGKPGRVWDLAADVADNILDGNPHADKLGNKDVWRFVRGPAKSGIKGKAASKVPANSVLGRWRSAASDPKQKAELAPLAEQVQALLTGKRPAQDKSPDRVLYDNLVSLGSPLLQGIDLARLGKARTGTNKPNHFGLDQAKFGEASVAAPATSVLEVRLPAALFRDREFVVEATLDHPGAEAVVQAQVLTAPPTPYAPWDGKGPLVATPGSAAAKQLLQGFTDFRRCFPQFICYPRIIPDDEVVCLKLYHREDEPLVRLFLDDERARQLDRLWARHRFITQFPVTEHKNLPLFIGFVTQDNPRSLVEYFESLREPFRKRAEEFEKDWEDAGPKQLEALTDFAARAYRRPLRDKEKAELTQLYASLRKKGLPHEEAFRTVLTRVLIAPSFLYRIEQAPPGKEAQPVSDWELATRLSYFLWATTPDAELQKLASAGRLRDPKVLAEQTERMLRDPKVRGLATEFATQWLHVRDIQKNREKNEKLFPTFDDKLRAAFFEESVLFCQDLFQNGRPMRSILDADHTFLNETLARHYGIPGVAGPQWRRVDGVKKYGRGGVLALGSVLTKQSGASRTSPVLRGNWLVETLLGEKLPKPPPDVPRLPEEETKTEETVRQIVEKHARIPQCAVCHQRIDPFGFALEKFDPIGRFRDKDLAGRPVDAKARLKDGTEFDGLDGLREYLLKKRRDEFRRHFCRKLLGYALGRSVSLSDQVLIDEMLDALKKDDRISTAVLTIVRSKQFRYHRGLEATREE